MTTAARTAARIDVWLVDLDRMPAWCDAGEASAAERGEALRFRFAHDRKRYLVSRIALRTILGRYCGLAPSALEFQAGAFGKPHLLQAPALAFNLSHSGALMALAIGAGSGAVGVDVESITWTDADARWLADEHFSGPERAFVDGAKEGGRAARIYQVWTRKEAYLKARGCGLSVPLDSFCTGGRCTGDAQDGAIVVLLPARQAQPWQVVSLAARAGYAMALSWAAECPAAIVCKDFNDINDIDDINDFENGLIYGEE